MSNIETGCIQDRTMVSKTWLKVLCLSPIAYILSNLVVSSPGLSLVFSLVGFIMFVVGFFLDAAELRKHGVMKPTRWWFLFVPVYIWKRCTQTGLHSREWFWIYIALCVVNLIVGMIALGMIAKL